MKKFAVFDIDGTVFRSSLLIELVEAMVDEGIFDEDVRRKYAKAQTAWLDRRGGYDEYLLAVINAFMEHIRGVRYEDFRTAGFIGDAGNPSPVGGKFGRPFRKWCLEKRCCLVLGELH